MRVRGGLVRGNLKEHEEPCLSCGDGETSGAQAPSSTRVNPKFCLKKKKKILSFHTCHYVYSVQLYTYCTATHYTVHSQSTFEGTFESTFVLSYVAS